MQNTKLIDQNPFIVSGYFHVFCAYKTRALSTKQRNENIDM